jgi:hypothetical protein
MSENLSSPIEYMVEFNLVGNTQKQYRHFQGYSASDVDEMFKQALVIDDIDKDNLIDYTISSYDRFSESWDIQKI